MQEKLSNEIAQLQKKMSYNQQSVLFARLADLYLGDDKVDEAIDLCQQGLKNHPNYATGYYVLAKCFYSQKQYDEAERRLKKAIAIEPKFVGAHYLYASILKEQGWSKSSEAAYRKIKEIDPFFVSEQNSQSDTFFDETVAEKELEPSELEDELEISTGFEDLQDFEQALELEKSESPQVEFEPESEAESLQEPEKKEPETPDLDFDLELEAPEQDLETSPEWENSEEEIQPTSQDTIDDITSGPQESEADETELISELEEQEDVEFQDNDVDTEETRFSELLDDIFRPEVDEEERTQRQVLESLEPEQESQEKAKEDIPAKEPIREPEPQQPSELDDEPLQQFDDSIHDIDKESDEDIDKDIEDTFEQDEQELSSFLASLEDDEDQDIDFDVEPDLQQQEEPVPAEREQNVPPPSHAPQSEEDKGAQSTKEKFVTPTLGEIYAAQGQYEKAIDVFEMLAKKHPDNEWYQTKLEYLNKKLQEERNKE